MLQPRRSCCALISEPFASYTRVHCPPYPLHFHSQVPPSRCVMLASAVSSKLLSSMAAVEGFRFVETLTGFKWLGSTALELERGGEQGGEGMVALFAFEEAIGFMLGGMFKVK